MARFAGNVGYGETKETAPGVYEDVITERKYYGDVTRNTRRLEGSDRVNMNILINNTISILADAYAYDHFFNMRYVWWMGTRWIVTNVEVERPRLILTLGGVYHDGTDSSSTA